MRLPEYEASATEVRQFALLQMALTAAFLVLIFFALGGFDADLPPWWVTAFMLAVVAAGVALAERVWLSASPLEATIPADELNARAVGVFAAQTVRKLMLTEGAVIVSVVVAFVGEWGGWPIVLGGIVGFAALVFETWPSLRNVSMTAAMLETDGADTGLVESFRSW